MHRMKLAPIAVAVLAAAGCPPPEEPCEADFDCGLGFSCSSGVCTANQPPAGDGGGDGGVGEGEGEGEGDNGLGELLIDTLEGEASMLLPASAIGNDDPDLAVVGEYTPGGVDQLRLFNLVTGTFDATSIDILQTSVGGNPGRCNVDHVTFEPDIGPPTGDDELWFSCALSGLQQARVTDLGNEIITGPGEGADLVVQLVEVDDINLDIKQRRVFARRGTPALFVEQIQFISDRVRREQDTVAVPFGEIAGLFVVTETDGNTIGDIVLVFDRAYPANGGDPALVPIERPFDGDTKTWVLARAPWAVLPLPVDTHAVRVGDVPDPANFELNNAIETQQNLEVFVPSLGVVVFGRLELEMAQAVPALAIDGSNGFTPLDFEDETPAAPPPSSDRILITPVPGDATSVFYVLRGANLAYGWKMKLHQNNNDNFIDDVEDAIFIDESADDPNGLVAIPGAGEAVWVALAGKRELHRITFDPR